MKLALKTIVLTPFLVLTSCVQKEHIKTVTFRLDMSQVEHVGNVGIRGPFTPNPWKETLYFQDSNYDGVYEGTIEQITAQNSVEFKFVNQDTLFELKNQDNRILNFNYKPETIIYEAIYNDPNGKQRIKSDD